MRYILALLILLTAHAHAANKYLREGATGTTGNDWTNAYTSLSTLEANLARGDTGYVADGTYGASTGATPNTTFNTTASGTTPITIKKATIADHGTSTGWSDAYGDGQALFNGELLFTSRYWVFDGVVGGGPPTSGGGSSSWKTGHGFKVVYTGGNPVVFVNGGGNVDVSHIEIQGSGDDGSGGGAGNDALQVFGGTGGATLSYAYAHDLGRCLVYHGGGSGSPITVSYTYTGQHESVSAEHSEWAILRSTALFTLRWSIITHTEGTGGIIAGDNGATTAEIYGNVFFNDGQFSWGTENNGLIAAFSTGSAQTNWKVYNNSFVNIPSALRIYGDSGASPSGNQARNNYFYLANDHSVSSGWTQSFEHFQSSGGTSGTNPSSGTGNPFVNYTNYDFNLNSNTTAGTTLSAPYNTDWYGRTRSTWTRGAIEFATADTTAPTPNPSTFSSNPAAVDSFRITMTATTSTDAVSGSDVDYFFDETTGNPGGTDSGWQDSPLYVDVGLSQNTSYTYRVKTRDATLNETTYSSTSSATTPALVSGARANCETLNVTTLQVAGPLGSAQTTSQFGFTYPAFTGAGGAMTAPQFVTSFSAAMHHPQQYRNWITEGKDIRLLNPSGIYAKHINIRTIYPSDLSHPNHDYVMNVHPEWLLLNGDGNPVSLFVPEEKCVDFANDDYLDWVLDTWLPTEFVDTTDDDSGLLTFYVHDNGNFLAQTITPNCSHSWCAPYKTDAGMQAAWKHMLDRFKARWPNKKILVSTGPVSYQTPAVQLPRFTDVLAHSDGYFSESLTSDHVYWSGQPNDQKRNALETTMQLADWLAVNDKYFFPNLGPGDGIEPTQAEVNYGYAFFNLMRAGTKQFFSMIVKDGSGNWQPEVYPEMNLALGTSLEARTQISTNVYRRRFANATAYVNLSDSSTNITLPVGTNKNSLGATVASPLTLGSFSGLTVYHY